MTNPIEELKKEFKKLRLLNHSEAEGILEDGTFISDWWINKLLAREQELYSKIDEELMNCHPSNFSEDDENAGYINGLIYAQSLLSIDSKEEKEV